MRGYINKIAKIAGQNPEGYNKGYNKGYYTVDYRNSGGQKITINIRLSDNSDVARFQKRAIQSPETIRKVFGGSSKLARDVLDALAEEPLKLNEGEYVLKYYEFKVAGYKYLFPRNSAAIGSGLGHPIVFYKYNGDIGAVVLTSTYVEGVDTISEDYDLSGEKNKQYLRPENWKNLQYLVKEKSGKINISFLEEKKEILEKMLAVRVDKLKIDILATANTEEEMQQKYDKSEDYERKKKAAAWASKICKKEMEKKTENGACDQFFSKLKDIE